MTAEAVDIFDLLHEKSQKAIQAFYEDSYSPDGTKQPKYFGITEASRLVGRNPQTIRDLEKQGKLPAPALITKTSDAGRERQFRMYTLKEINAMRDYFGTRPKRPKKADPVIIAVMNFKGGVWKSTISLLLAQCFALKGYRTLLTDSDSQGTITHGCGWIPDRDIPRDGTMLKSLIGEDDDLTNVIRKTHWDSLDVIPANLSLYNAEFILPALTTDAKSRGESFHFYNMLSPAIDSIKDNYDIILLDCPPSLGMISMNVLYAANALLIPTPPSMYDFSSTNQFFAMMRDTLGRFPEKKYDFTKLVITKANKRSSDVSAMMKKIRTIFGEFVTDTELPVNEAVRKSSSDMRTIFEVDDYRGSKETINKIREAVHQLSSELLAIIHRTWDDKVSTLTSGDSHE